MQLITFKDPDYMFYTKLLPLHPLNPQLESRISFSFLSFFFIIIIDEHTMKVLKYYFATLFRVEIWA